MTSIILLSHGRLRLLEQCLRSLSDNTDKNSFSLVVVSDGETDFRISKLLRSLERRHVSLLEVSNSGHVLANLKNIGVAWSAARFGYKTGIPHHAYDGDYVGVFDSDVCFFPGWLPKMIDALAKASFGEGRSVMLVGGCRHPFHGINGLMGDDGYIEKTDAVAGYSHFMRWDTWERFGPYPSGCAAGIGQSEDHAFSRKIVESGNSVGYINPPVLAHCGITDSNGNPAIGADQFVRVPGVLYE